MKYKRIIAAILTAAMLSSSTALAAVDSTTPYVGDDLLIVNRYPYSSSSTINTDATLTGTLDGLVSSNTLEGVSPLALSSVENSDEPTIVDVQGWKADLRNVGVEASEAAAAALAETANASTTSTALNADVLAQEKPSAYDVDATRDFITYDMLSSAVNQGAAVTNFTLAYNGTSCTVWVATSIAGNSTTDYAAGSEVTYLDAAKTVGEAFDTEIYPYIEEKYGAYDDMDGDGKTAFLIYDCGTAGSTYTAGFFLAWDMNDIAEAGYTTLSNQADVMHLNANTISMNGLNVLEQTLAHEFVHLVVYSGFRTLVNASASDEYNAGRETYGIMPDWLNEGLAQSAQHMLYGKLTDRIGQYNSGSPNYAHKEHLLYSFSSDSNEVLYNYASSYLFVMYMQSLVAAENNTDGSELYKQFIGNDATRVYTSEGQARTINHNLYKLLNAAAGASDVATGPIASSMTELVESFSLATVLKEPSGKYGFGRFSNDFISLNRGYTTSNVLTSLNSGSSVLGAAGSIYADISGFGGSGFEFVHVMDGSVRLTSVYAFSLDREYVDMTGCVSLEFKDGKLTATYDGGEVSGYTATKYFLYSSDTASAPTVTFADTVQTAYEIGVDNVNFGSFSVGGNSTVALVSFSGSSNTFRGSIALDGAMTLNGSGEYILDGTGALATNADKVLTNNSALVLDGGSVNCSVIGTGKVYVTMASAETPSIAIDTFAKPLSGFAPTEVTLTDSYGKTYTRALSVSLESGDISAIPTPEASYRYVFTFDTTGIVPDNVYDITPDSVIIEPTIGNWTETSSGVYSTTVTASAPSFNASIAVDVSDKTYDGTSAAATAGVTLNGSPYNATPTVTYSGTTAAGTAYSSSDAPTAAGSYTATATVTILGKEISASKDFTIAPKPLTVTNAAATNRDADGTTTVTVSGTLTGIVGNDGVTLTLAGSVADAAAGENKAVTVTATLSGEDASNYTVTAPTGVTVTINAVTTDGSDGNAGEGSGGTGDSGDSSGNGSGGNTGEGSGSGSGSGSGGSGSGSSGSDSTGGGTGGSTGGGTGGATGGGSTGGSAGGSSIGGSSSSGSAGGGSTGGGSTGGGASVGGGGGFVAIEVPTEQDTENEQVVAKGEDGFSNINATVLGEAADAGLENVRFDLGDGSAVNIDTGDLVAVAGISGVVSATLETTETEDGTTVYTVGVQIGSWTLGEEELVGGISVELSAEDIGPGHVAYILAEDGTKTMIMDSCVYDGVMHISLDAGAQIVVEDASVSFSDAETHWGSDAVDFATSHGLFLGVTESEFQPDTKMNRGMLITVLHRLAETPESASGVDFADIPADMYYADPIAWGVEQGIVTGVSDTHFEPGRDVKREEVAVMLYRYAMLIGAVEDSERSLDGYNDADSVSSWAVDAMSWAAEQGIITGRPGDLLDPSAGATRAEVATMMWRFVRAIIAK